MHQEQRSRVVEHKKVMVGPKMIYYVLEFIQQKKHEQLKDHLHAIVMHSAVAKGRWHLWHLLRNWWGRPIDLAI